MAISGLNYNWLDLTGHPPLFGLCGGKYFFNCGPTKF